MSSLSDFPVGTKVVFVEDYEDFFYKGQMTTIVEGGYYSYGRTVLRVKNRNRVINCYAERVRRLHPDNPLNRILYPELKPDGEGYLLWVLK